MLPYFTALNVLKIFSYVAVPCEPGYCMNAKGDDVNYEMLGLTGTEGDLSEEQCLNKCQIRRNSQSNHMTACEYRKDKKTCSGHTLPISYGNGNENYTCCIYEKGSDPIVLCCENVLYWIRINSSRHCINIVIITA